MCSLTSPAGEVKQSKRRSKRIKKRKQMESNKSPSDLETSRKQIRTKTKRPKFLSLKLELSTSHEIEESPGAAKSKKKKKKKHKPSKQSKTKGGDTTPFKEKKKRAETVGGGGGEKEEEQYDTVAAYLFSSATDSSMSSIQDLLPSSDVHVDCSERKNLSPYDRGGSSASSSLLKTAMRKGASKEEETTEERWVSYSEVVEEVMSRSGTPRPDGKDGRPSLTLKLDYEQIMEAWSDKGTLYVDGEPPQTVPDLHASADVFTGGGDAGSLWTVPEMKTTERLWRGHREASLLRYKEKRQNRLFSKRIRYEVRKLNAEKRPRVKGRFVKRDD
ncbi:CCT domain-containing protein [Hirschfeldia incana]|nr:CCT domain-containing protein [Hirschfeldia incana]